MKIETKVVDNKDYGKSVLYVPPVANGNRAHKDVVEAKLISLTAELAVVQFVSGKDAKGNPVYNPPQPVLISNLVWK